MEPPVIPPDPIRPARIEYPLSPRLQRIRRFSYLLDQSIRLPGGYRIGIDPIVGLLPGVGDTVAAAFSIYIVYEAARMGIPKRTLLKMSRNVLIETIVGEFPVLGDIFDAVFKANIRNARLVEESYNPTAKERSFSQVSGYVLLFFIGIVCIAFGLLVFFIWLFVKLYGILAPSSLL